MILANLSRAKALRISAVLSTPPLEKVVGSIAIPAVLESVLKDKSPVKNLGLKLSTLNKGVGRKLVYISLPAFLYLSVNQS